MANCAYYTRQITVHETSVAILCALFYNTLADDALFCFVRADDQCLIKVLYTHIREQLFSFCEMKLFYFEDRVMMNASDLVNSEKHE